MPFARGKRAVDYVWAIRFKFCLLHKIEIYRYSEDMPSSSNKRISVQWQQTANPDAEAIRRVYRILLRESDEAALVDSGLDEMSDMSYSIRKDH